MSEYDSLAPSAGKIPPPFDSSLEGAPGASGAESTPDLSAWDADGRSTPTPTENTPASDAEPAATDLSHESQHADGDSDSDSDDEPRHVSILFRDALDLPIEDLDVSIPLQDGSTFNGKTSPQGAVTLPLPAKATGTLQVKVKDSTGALQTVCSLDVAKCTNAAIVRSPKVAVKAPLRAHQQTPPAKSTTSPAKASPATAKQGASGAAPAASAASAGASAGAKPPTTGSVTWWGDNGALAHAWSWVKSEIGLGDAPPAQAPASPVLKKALSPAGQPVTLIAGPECPNPDKLRLGRNNVFRPAIVDAAKRLGLIPQALCALMDCEAGKVTEHIPKLGPDGKPLKDKKGKPLATKVCELWNANAGNAQSGAAGLTQFLGSTWLGHVLIPGRYIHDQSVARGWVRQETPPKGKPHWVFVLSDGKTRTQVARSDYSDANVKACLAMRMDPVWSINAAADYGAANLKLLEGKGFNLSSLTDMNKAKLMYLLHHEGEGSGPLFIRNTLGTGRDGVDGLRSKFATQLGASGATAAAKKIKDAGGDVEVAYRQWLSKFIDGNFSGTAKYFCSSPLDCDLLSDILVSIGGEKIRKVD